MCILSGVVFGAVCDSSSTTCSEVHNECSSTNKCACVVAAYRNQADSACVTSRYHNRITKTEWVNEPSLNIHLQRPKCCPTPVLLP